MILGGFDNTLKTLSADRTVMSNANSFNVVRDLMTIVNSVQGLAGAVANSNIHDMLAMSLMGKISELESIITMFGNQRLTTFGINTMPNPMMGSMQPIMPGMQMHNQSFYYPTMGQQQMYPAGNQFQTPMAPPAMQPMPQPTVMPPPPPPAPAPAPLPPAEPSYAPSPAPIPAPSLAHAPAPAPARAVAPAPVPSPAAPSPRSDASSSIAKGGVLPGVSLPGLSDDKPAAGRDYILKLLEER